MLYHELITGQKMPMLGLGTWMLKGELVVSAVKNALQLGYRHIDTAMIYENEEGVGKAIRESGIPRKEIFLTSKLWKTNYTDVQNACEKSLQRLGTEYLDLYLIHWPGDVPIPKIIKAMNLLVKQGKVKNIGVSNFSARQCTEAQGASDVPIVVNQVECHPLFRQEKLLNFCEKNNIALTAYSPLGRGKCFENKAIQEIAIKYGKSPAQVCLRWLVQRGCVVIPKASSIEHIKENLTVFDWELSKEDMVKLTEIKAQERVVDLPFCKWNEWE